MKRVLFIVSILMLFFFPLYAQQEGESLKQSIRWNPVRLATGTFQLEYEHQVASDFTLSFMGMGTYAADKGLGGWYINRLKDRENYNQSVMTGLGLMVQPRYYMFDAMDEPKGVYVGANVLYRNMWITYKKESSSEDQRDTSPLGIVAGGAVFGIQWPIVADLVVDAYAGPVLRLSNYGHEDGPSNYNAWTALDHSGVTLQFGLSFGFVR